ncbi:MAG: alpha/beta hydrolase [Chitinophagales bacterium]
MNWKTKLVLQFTKLKKPIDGSAAINIHKLRKNAASGARLGSLLFDEKIKIKGLKDTEADGVPIRIYRDSDETDLPVMIYYHGGGFVVLDLDSHDRVCRRLCKMNNCIVVSVDYRLAPEHSFPLAHDDAFTAINWVLNHIGEYRGNPEKLILAGDSAGGNLAACMAHRCKREQIPVKAQILIYPWIDGKMDNPSIERNGEGYMLTKDALFWYREQYTPNPEDQCRPEVSPCYEKDFKGLPPAFVLTAEFDPLLDDGKKYFDQLKRAGNNGLYKEYPNMIHGFFNMPKISPDALQAYKDIQIFLNLALAESKS